MSIDDLVVNPGRLKILTALASEPRQRFVQLRGRTGLTDGNLATHARRLRSAGLIAIDKQIEAGKPVTTMDLTIAGREALVRCARALAGALEGSSVEEGHEPAIESGQSVEEDEWVD